MNELLQYSNGCINIFLTFRAAVIIKMNQHLLPCQQHPGIMHVHTVTYSNFSFLNRIKRKECLYLKCTVCHCIILMSVGLLVQKCEQEVFASLAGIKSAAHSQ